MNHIEIKDHINRAFGVNAEVETTANLILIRVKGIDTCSLAKWLAVEIDNIKISTRHNDGYHISDMNWIKIEQNDNKKSTIEIT